MTRILEADFESGIKDAIESSERAYREAVRNGPTTVSGTPEQPSGPADLAARIKAARLATAGAGGAPTNNLNVTPPKPTTTRFAGLQQKLTMIRDQNQLFELFVFDDQRKCIADASGKKEGSTYRRGGYLPTDLPLTGESTIERSEDAAEEPYRSRCKRILDDQGNADAWVYAQTAPQEELRLQGELKKLSKRLFIGSLLASLFVISTFAIVIAINRRTQRTQQKINEQARMDMISLLSTALMHEIKTPLGTINGSGQLLEKHFAKENSHDELGELAGYIVSESERIKEIINSSLGTGNINEIGSLKLDSFMTKVVRSLYPSIAKKKVTVTNEIEKDFHVLAATMPLRLVFTNLITNAVQAVNDNTGLVRISAIRKEGQVGIQVVDNGKGISKGKFKDLFRLFASERKGGSGIGLAASNQAVMEMNGWIDVESTVGKGTTFTVWLPTGTPEATAASPLG